MIQTKSQTSKRLTLNDARVAVHIKAFSSDPDNVASVLQAGINAILAAVVHFAAEPPQIAIGVSELGVKLFESLEMLLSEEHRSTEEFRAIRTRWITTFGAIPDTEESVKKDLNLFVENGDNKALVRAIITIVNEAGQILGATLPETGNEIMKYLSAISDAMETIGDGWGNFFQGNTIQGIEGIYGGLKLVAESILPAEIQNSEVFDKFVGSMDNVVSLISNTVLDYERRILEAHVCWRSEHSRIRQRPRVCEDGYRWDGQQSCTRLSSLLSVSSKTTSLDASVSGKGGDAGTLPAHCDETSGFDEKYNHWCYGDCEPGFSTKDDTKCITTCAGKFPSESGYLCGRDYGVLVKAQVEMVTVVINGLFELHDAIQQMKEDGINGDTLTSTIQVFIDMGKPFAKPICPVVMPPPTPNPPIAEAAVDTPAANMPSSSECSSHADCGDNQYCYDYGKYSVGAWTGEGRCSTHPKDCCANADADPIDRNPANCPASSSC